MSHRVFGTSMVEEYEEIADPPERPDDLDDDFGKNLMQNDEAGQGRLFEPVALLSTDYPPGYTPEVKLSKNLIGSAKGGFTVVGDDAV